jgi:Uma2 family endonuclease
MQQNKHLTRADQTLETWFHGRRENVLVNGQGYLCPDRRNVRSCPVPDCVVAFDVDPERIATTNGYVISEAGKPPEFVLEVASETTGVRDYTIKRDRYAEMCVGEYWRFDRTGGRYRDAALAGDRLVDGAYVPIPITEEPDGEIWGYSEALELALCWTSGQLRFYDPVGRAYLPRQTELKDRLDAALLENERLRELLRRRQAES